MLTTTSCCVGWAECNWAICMRKAKFAGCTSLSQISSCLQVADFTTFTSDSGADSTGATLAGVSTVLSATGFAAGSAGSIAESSEVSTAGAAVSAGGAASSFLSGAAIKAFGPVCFGADRGEDLGLGCLDIGVVALGGVRSGVRINSLAWPLRTGNCSDGLGRAPWVKSCARCSHFLITLLADGGVTHSA